jgi:hypothetical protein
MGAAEQQSGVRSLARSPADSLVCLGFRGLGDSSARLCARPSVRVSFVRSSPKYLCACASLRSVWLGRSCVCCRCCVCVFVLCVCLCVCLCVYWLVRLFVGLLLCLFAFVALAFVTHFSATMRPSIRFCSPNGYKEYS